jgi:hypothetical protein
MSQLESNWIGSHSEEWEPQWLSEEIVRLAGLFDWNHSEWVKGAIERHPGVLTWAPFPVRDDRELMGMALKRDASVWKWLSPRLRDDRELMRMALDGDCWAADVMQVASQRLQDDRELALIAVAKTGDAWRWVSARLKRDRELALVALRDAGYHLEHMGREWKGDPEVVLAAMESHMENLKWADTRLQALFLGLRIEEVRELVAVWKRTHSMDLLAI